MKKILWLLFLPLIFSFSSCEKNEPNPSGKNLFTSKIDGKDFKAQSDDWKSKATHSNVTNDTLTVSGVNNVNQSVSLGFRIENFKGKGTYILDTNRDNYGRYTFNSLNTFTNDNHTGQVVVTHYIPEKAIVAGTFSYTTVDPNTGEIYHITDGKFDMTYTTQ